MAININLGSIDPFKKFPDLKISIAKPNRKTIGNLAEATGRNLNLKLGRINEIKFRIPYKVERNHISKKNPNIKKLKQRYLLKVKWGTYTEWYKIMSSNKVMQDDGEFKEIVAYSLPIELGDKKVNGIEEDTKNIQEISTLVLRNSVWGLGFIDSEFLTRYRKFEFTNTTTVLDAIFKIAETFEALIIWDSERKLINFHKSDSISSNKGLLFDYGKYLNSLNEEEKTDEMVTRLYIYGHDGLTINSINPSGTSYIEDFSYFMYPFNRDENKNVLQESDYMSNELCHAILDYQQLLTNKDGEFKSLLESQETQRSILATKNTELFHLQTELMLLEDMKDMKQTNNEYFSYNYLSNTTHFNSTITTSPTRYYLLLIKSDNNLNINVNNQQYSILLNQWRVLKFNNINSLSMLVQSGQLNYTIQAIVSTITETEFNTGDEFELNKKYNHFTLRQSVELKRLEIQDVQNNLALLEQQIENLQNDISIENNFTPELIVERDQFIIEKEWIDDNYIDVHELLEVGKKVLSDLRKPKTILNLDIVNFLKFTECQRDWNKLALGDRARAKHPTLEINSESQIIEMDIDFESDSLNLTIANTRNLNTDDDSILSKLIYDTISTSATINMNKHKWNEVTNVKTAVSSLIESEWDSTKRQIIAGVNNSVTIDRRGITITDTEDGSKFLRATNGVLAITNDSGNTYKNAITHEGLIGERIIGKVLISENLVMENENKSVVFDKDGLTIQSSALNIPDGIGAGQIDPNFGKVIDISENNVITSIAHDIQEIENGVSGNATAIQQNADEISLRATKQEVTTAVGGVQTQLDNMFSDLKVTPLEKKTLLTNWEAIKSQYTQLHPLAVSLQVVTTNYTNAYNALNNTTPKIETDILFDMSTTYTFVDETARDTFRNQLIKYYDEAEKISKSITESIISSTDQKINALRLGARNLLIKSSCQDVQPTLAYNDQRVLSGLTTTNIDNYMTVTVNRSDTTDNFYQFGSTLIDDAQGFENGKEYTISFEAFIPNELNVNLVIRSMVYDGVWRQKDFQLTDIQKGLWKRYEVTFDFSQIVDPTLAIGKMFRLMIPSNVIGANIQVRFMKLEEGNIGTSWTPAIEDITSDIENARNIARDAQINVNNIMSDMTVTSVEKSILKNDWEAIKAKHTQLLALAQSVNLNTTNYVNAYNALNGTSPKIESEVLANMDITYTFASEVARDTFKQKLITYFTQSEMLTKSITDVVKGEIDDMFSDMKITPIEKISLKEDWGYIKNQYTQLLSFATSPTINVPTTTFTTAYNNLNGVTPMIETEILVSMTSTYTFASTTARDNFKLKLITYYNEADKLGRAITDKVNQRIDNITIGGRNLLKNTTNEFQQINMGSWNSSYTNNNILTEMDLKHGDEITMSVYVKIPIDSPSGVATRLSFYREDGTYSTVLGNYFVLAGEEGLTTLTATIPSDCVSIRVMGHRQGASASATTFSYEYKRLKLEKGNKPTDWTPAPEDIDAHFHIVEERISTAESKITDSAIVNTVTNSISFKNVLNSKANSDDLEGYATKNELGDLEGKLNSDLDAKIGLIDFSPYVTQSELDQKSTDITSKFSASGGVNILRNSIGFADFSFWARSYSSLTSIVRNNEINAVGFGSGFAFSSNGTNVKDLRQTITVIPNRTYTLSFHLKKQAGGTSGDNFIALAYNESVLSANEINRTSIGHNVERNYELVTLTFTPTNSQVVIRFYAESNVIAVVTGVMLNVGDTPLSWTMHPEEIYNSNIRMDLNGIRVSQLEDGVERGYTQINSTEFAGYYDVNGNGIHEKVFYLKEDETVSKKFQAKEEFTMGSIKIIKINSGGNNGWAFVPTTP